MELFRITRCKYVQDLSGEGAKRFGGRWNPKGVAVIYTSMHESLAALETLVHAPIAELPKDLCLAVLQIPDNLEVQTISKSKLPERWKEYPAPAALQKKGSDWVEKGICPLLKVPSSVISSEYNILLNPNHPKMNAVKIKEARSFSFDSRLTK